jgi:DNA-binding PadR family transcriptional regulator
MCVILEAMRRKGDSDLVPFERQLLEAALELRRKRVDQFHGYLLMACLEKKFQLVGPGFSTLYRALRRLDEMGFLKSWWVNPAEGGEARPRRMYKLTMKGIAAANASEVKSSAVPHGKRATV